ncbi:MAG: hypothetical protein R3230_04190 [Nitrosopumilaceae archaeon]|nr:hypothetical protein [Nitrosopumilaceae archaeon]
MHIDRRTGFGIIVGLAIIFSTISFAIQTQTEIEYDDPWSYQTMRSKLLNLDSTSIEKIP